ncbi:MAG TPA: lamin tail domain-containing protein [Solirubrobacter sp.]
MRIGGSLAARTAAALAVGAGFAVAAVPASADIRINEIESQDAGGGNDWVELTNTGAATVDIGNYVLRDSGQANPTTIPAGTMLQPGAFFATDSNAGLGNPDEVRLFDAGATLIDNYAYADHAGSTYGRCPDGTGAFINTERPTRGAANACPPVGSPWPGGAAISILDDAATFGQNVSGLAYQPSGTAAPGVLWGVRNSNASSLFRMLPNGALWSPDVAGGYTKTLVYKNGGGAPDAEGVTLADGDPNAVYVATERDGNGGSLPKILRYDTSSAGATLSATNEWDLSPDLPGLGANLGLEAIAFVPDDLLVKKGLIDQQTGAKYDPANYPGHGQGLFFVGVEQDGQVVGYALNRANDTYTRITKVASTMSSVMELEYEPETTHLWAMCDNNCQGRSVTLDVDAGTGNFAATKMYARPGGMDNFNNEGFAIAPQAECVNGLKPTFYAEDSDANGHALRGGTINCKPLEPQVTPTPTPQPAAATPTPTPKPPPVVVVRGPSVKLALKLTKTGTYAVRKTGKFAVVITLSERSDLTISATARKNAKAKARTILRATTRKGVAGGKPTTLKLSLSAKVRKALRKGETVTLTVVARNAAGKATTTTISAKVK